MKSHIFLQAWAQKTDQESKQALERESACKAEESGNEGNERVEERVSLYLCLEYSLC